MLRLCILLVLTGCLGTTSYALPPGSDLAALTKQAADLDAAARKERDPTRKKALLAEVETLLHRMGPVDAEGRPVRPKAMWHAHRIDAMDADSRLLASGKAATAAVRGQGQFRRMAAACLRLGWAMPDGPAKYQMDAFGAYLANNSIALDKLFQDLDVALRAADKAGPDAKQAAAGARAEAEKGVAQMAAAADALAAESGEATVPADSLSRFLKGLEAVGSALGALRGVSPSREEETAAAADVPIADEAKRDLARVREVAKGLSEEPWHELAKVLEENADAAETGLKIASLQAQAGHMLRFTRMGAEVAEGLRSGSAVWPPAYVDFQRERMARCLIHIRGAQKRSGEHTDIEAAHALNRFRVAAEAMRLSPRSMQGWFYAWPISAPPLKQLFPDAKNAKARPYQWWQGYFYFPELPGRIERLGQGLPDGMLGPFKPLYTALQTELHGALEDAGRLLGTDWSPARPRTEDVGNFLDNLDRLARASDVVRSVQKRVPRLARPVFERVLKVSTDLVKNPKAGRGRFDGLVQPLETLDRLQAMDPRLLGAVARIGGRGYKAASARMGRQLVQGIEAVCNGDGGALVAPMGAAWMFRLLGDRAASEVPPLKSVEVGNLLAFSLAKRDWAQYLRAVDRELETALAQYAAQGESPTIQPSLAVAEEVCVLVRQEQEAALDALERDPVALVLEHLARCAETNPPTTAWHDWAVGHHLVEIAASANAGYGPTAEWHASQVRRYSAPAKE